MRRGDIVWAAGISLLAGGVAVSQIGLQWALIAYLVAASATGPLVVVDLREHRLPNVFTLPAYPVIAALLALAAVLEGDVTSLLRALAAGIVVLAAFVLLHLINASGMGMGDVKLAGPVAMLLGWVSWNTVLWGIFLGFLTGAVWSILLLVMRRATRRSHIAFGPFMLLGLWLSLIWLA